MSKLPQVIITADSEAVLAKKKAWSEVGLIVHNANIQLTEKAKEAISLLIPPKTIDEVSAAESTLKDVKSKLSIIELERKAVTSKFDAVTSALMTHEKLVKDSLPAFQNAIISIKKAHEQEQAQIKFKAEAEKRLKEVCLNMLNNSYSKAKDMVADVCQKAYEYALGAGNVTEAKLPAYLTKVKAKYKAEDFKINCPTTMPEEMFTECWKQLDMPSEIDMLAYFHRAVDAKFEFYSVAIKNKDAAIKMAKEVAEKEAAERAEELANQAVATRLEVIATSADVTIDSGVKELKKFYALDMEDTEQNALLIIAAFVSNFNTAKDGVRVKSMFKLSVEQMGAALAWMKNKDENFKCSGINFKINDKL